MSRRALIISAVVVLIVGGGGLGYLILRPDPPSGETSVRAFFDDLARGDTRSALGRVAGAEQLSLDEYPLLDAKALADKANRPTDLKVVRRQTLSDLQGYEIHSVQVTYRLGEQTVNQTITAGREGGTEGDFLLAGQFLRFSVQNAGSRKLVVNGIDVDADTVRDTYVFPGVYRAEARASALVTGDSKPAVVRVAGSGVSAVVTLNRPALASGAGELITREVKQIIDKCAESRSPRPANCPFRLFFYGENTSVVWKVVTYPVVTATVSTFGSAEVTFGSSSSGVIHYDATTAGSDGQPQTDSDEQSFRVSGTASTSGSAITVSLN